MAPHAMHPPTFFSFFWGGALLANGFSKLKVLQSTVLWGVLARFPRFHAIYKMSTGFAKKIRKKATKIFWEKAYSTQCSQVVAHLSTNWA